MSLSTVRGSALTRRNASTGSIMAFFSKPWRLISKNKFVRTKMRPKEGTKIELQRDLSDFVRFLRFSGLDLSDLSDLPISAI